MELNPTLRGGRGREDEYFHRLESERLARKRGDEARAAAVEALANALGVRAALAERIYALGIDADTAAAFQALPLVEVAWADGAVDAEERWRVLEAATRLGVELGRPAHAVLEEWLERRPAEALFTAWHGWALHAGRDPSVLTACHGVACAAGGVLGFRPVSSAERRALDRIRRSLAGVAGHAA